MKSRNPVTGGNDVELTKQSKGKLDCLGSYRGLLKKIPKRIPHSTSDASSTKTIELDKKKETELLRCNTPTTVASSITSDSLLSLMCSPPLVLGASSSPSNSLCNANSSQQNESVSSRMLSRKTISNLFSFSEDLIAPLLKEESSSNEIIQEPKNDCNYIKGAYFF